MGTLQRIRRAIRNQRYRISSHANEEMSVDGIETQDVERIILTGKIIHKFTHDLRGIRYEIGGDTTDGRHAYAVRRFLSSGVLLIITAYAEEAG
jgi:hypothetical protein